MFKQFAAGEEVEAAKLNQLGVAYLGTSAVGTDAYAFTPTPALAAYVDGITCVFTADVSNDGAATLEISGLGAKAIVKGEGTALVTGDIVAGQNVLVSYNATDDNFLMISPPAVLVDGSEASKEHYHSVAILQGTRDITAASGNVNYAHGLGRTPKWVEIIAFLDRFPSTTVAQYDKIFSHGASDGTNHKCTAWGGYLNNASGAYTMSLGNQAAAAVYIDVPGTAGAGNCNRLQSATVSFDGTNVVLAWTKTDANTTLPTGTIHFTMIVH